MNGRWFVVHLPDSCGTQQIDIHMRIAYII
jgi:hypothetical protein